LSEEICRPFFALYASGLDGPIALSAELLAGIPLTTFLLTWAFSQPFGATILRRFGASTCLATAAALTGTGMLATGFSDSWWGLIFLRALTGFGFGCVLIVTQALLLRIGRSTGRAKAMSGFVAAIVAAGICGPVIGGLLAVKFGTTFAFAVAGCCALVAIVFSLGTKDVSAAAAEPRAFSVRATFEAMRHARLLLLIVFSAIPGKLAATAVLMMLVPLATMELGESPAVAGRLLLLYFLGFFLLSGVAARLSDKLNVRKPFIAAGGVVSALACFSGYAFGNLWGLVIACSLLGMGQAWLASPQIVLVTQLIESKGSTADSELALGFYRLVERLGGAMGPLVAAFFISHYGLDGAMLGFGLLLGVGCLITLVTLWSYQEQMSSHFKSVKVGQAS
jgi:MFS family permease